MVEGNSDNTSTTPWSAMDERAWRHHRAKEACTCARADATHFDLCKARIYWAPSHTQNLNAILLAVCEIWKTGVHVRTCRCTPPQTCRKHLSNGSLATQQIWTQSTQPFARSGNGCARAHVEMHSTSDMRKALIWWVPSHTPNLNTIRPAVCEMWKTGVHVRTCRCSPPQTCGQHLFNGSLVTHQIWTQSGQPLWSYRGRGCLRHPPPARATCCGRHRWVSVPVKYEIYWMVTSNKEDRSWIGQPVPEI